MPGHESNSQDDPHRRGFVCPQLCRYASHAPLLKVAMTVGKGKRPRDANQLAKWIVDRSTDETPEPEIDLNPAASTSSTIPPHVSEYMSAIGREGGQIGGKRRLKTMTKEARRKVAAKAARSRWGSKKRG